ncbi:kinase-like domain-containing protein [Globomyces pollinis-pini]|nr:kinase-like domain-containing protein [Globomyces pollinis-pini]
MLVSLKRFDLLAIVGQGAFGKVRIVAEKKSKKEYALKYMDKKEIISQKATTHVFRERMLLQQLASQFIVGLRYAFQDDDHLFMILELAKGGDLRFHMNMDKQPLDDCTLQIYAAELGFALDYMHKQKIIHRFVFYPNHYRDLKPENILLDQDGHILLTDFNIAVSVAEKLPTSESGTLIYMAPEMLTDTPYSYSVDWWATGTILYECIYKKLPFCNGDEDPDTIKELIAKKKLDFPAENACKVKITPNQARDVFMAELLERDVSKRLGSENNGLGFETQMKCHPYLSKLDWKQVEEKKLTPKYKPNVRLTDDFMGIE